ncbi:vWA domain-containing protein [Persicirhabdus sediminis]|uniref:VWA domain-containing protein n=1 Tax=Persicirhabdus sediminis TaxID=454144 RepID=A0A8J7SJQ4_9BACT|nr:VWA domain-containing protein [Persicirhabdus sediminis]MBK1791261.1 VWA domain-containing protein [Persicirhabdus sediminis]
MADFTFLDNFTFANPGWLLLLIPTICLIFIRGRKRTPETITFSSLSVLASLGQKPSRAAGGIRFPLMIFALIAAIIGLARPQWTNSYTERTASGIDIILAIDISKSMETVDFAVQGQRTTRMVVAKATAENFIEQRKDDRLGIVAFAGRPYVTSPITLDHEWLIGKLRELDPDLIGEQGTAIGSAIAASATRLDGREAKSKIIVLLTDGANNSGKLSPIEAAKLAKELDIKIYTVAIGSEKGRLSRDVQATPKQEFNPEVLQEIAKLTEAEYFHAKTTDDLVDTFATIDELEKTEIKTHTIVDVKELFPYYVGAAILLSLCSLLVQSLRPTPAP